MQSGHPPGVHMGAPQTAGLPRSDTLTWSQHSSLRKTTTLFPVQSSVYLDAIHAAATRQLERCAA
jgi:hypothetical protein